jgi:simple sugar transport system permease protein
MSTTDVTDGTVGNAHGPSSTDSDPKSIPERRLHRLLRAPELGIAVAAIAIYLFFVAFASGNGFLSLTATASWLNSASQLGIIAVPLALVMISGSFDLSIGSMVGAGSITVGIFTGYLHDPLWVSVLAAAAIGILVGVGNGLLVTRTNLPSFIVTLAANLIVFGLGLAISQTMTGSTTISITTHGAFAKVFDGQSGAFSVSNLWWLGSAVAAGWLLTKTRFGNWTLATGGDPEGARRAGVPTGRLTVILFIMTSLAATFVGVMQAVQYGTGDPTTGQGYVFEAAIVVVIGGVLITGGYGTILGVILGTAIYGIVDAGLFYTGWNTDYTQVVIGVLMVIAVLINNFLRKIALNAFKGRSRER